MATRRTNRSIGVSGLEELHKAFKALGESLNDPDVEQAFLDEAEVLQADMRARVPERTGNLRRGIVAKTFASKIKYRPAAFTAIDYRVAPHAHLVEFGTIHAAAHPFFRPALRGFASKFYRRIGAKLGRKIEQTAARNK